MRSFTFLAVGLFLCGFFFVGCSVSENSVGTEIVEVQKDTVPFPPRGVYSITGDGSVEVFWWPNQEDDIAGYVIYRSLDKTSNYEEIGTVDLKTTAFTDTTVQNGITYFYAVSAVDMAKNKSELSGESVFDTPRPAGSVTLQDYSIVPQSSGFSLTHTDRVQSFNNNTTDLYFGVDTAVAVPYFYSDNGTQLQDKGWTDSFDEISFAPTQGFTSLFVEAIEGHTYCFLTPDGHYAKIRVTKVYVQWAGEQVQSANVKFDWAYQLQAGNPELAPPKQVKK